MSRNAPRLALIAILALFVLPLALAWLMYTGTIDLEPRGTDNQGRLVIPPQPVDWNSVRQETPEGSPDPLEGAWVVLYPLPETCEADCLERIRVLRQVHRAIGRQADRVRIAVVAMTPLPGELAGRLRRIHPRLHLLFEPAEAFRASLERAGEGAADPSVYLVDPLGNVMMTYEADDDMNKLYKDLDKLLTWSKLDEQS